MNKRILVSVPKPNIHGEFAGASRATWRVYRIRNGTVEVRWDNRWEEVEEDKSMRLYCAARRFSYRGSFQLAGFWYDR